MTTRSAVLTDSQIEDALAAALPRVARAMEASLRDKSLADEMASDSVSAAWEQWRRNPAYFAGRDLVGWATQRARWRATDTLRRRLRSAPLAEEHSHEESDAKAPEVPAASQPDRAAREELHRFVYETVQMLEPEDRQLLEGMAYDNLTDQAMGNALYGPQDATQQARGLRVFRRRQRALARLGQLLREHGFDAEAWAAGQAV